MPAAHPSFNPSAPYDLTALAANGLRRGFTTGTSAAAAAKAALILMLRGVLPASVKVTLPDGEHYISVPISAITQTTGWSSASVIKDGGDDPDQTHGARVIVRVRPNAQGRVVFMQGPGVGTVTQPGLRLPIGDPAINATPRAMIRNALSEVLETDDPDPGFDVEVGCENGDAIAQKTFNPRLGIIGGISILGTTGIVEPKSLASFKASIEVYIRVALGNTPHEIVLSPGNLGQRFARAALQLPLQQIVQTSNFMGFALDALTSTLEEASQSLPLLWVVGHPGKLAKVICGHWDTHSSHGTNAIEGLRVVAAQKHPNFIEPLSRLSSTEACIESFRDMPGARDFWSTVEGEIGRAITSRIRNVGEVRVKLFSMDGTALGENQ